MNADPCAGKYLDHTDHRHAGGVGAPLRLTLGLTAGCLNEPDFEELPRWTVDWIVNTLA